MWIYETDNWMNFDWDKPRLNRLVESTVRDIGFLYGRLSSLGLDDQLSASAENLTDDIVSSFRIEGVSLNTDQVRSSIENKLGIRNRKDYEVSPTHYIEGVVDVMFDATRNCNEPLTAERLFGWHCALFPSGRSGYYNINTGTYRKDDIAVISGAFGHERVHYQAPDPSEVPAMMEEFINWYNSDTSTPIIIKSAVSHLIFECIHPFDDGNGRIGRAIADMTLAQMDGGKQRFYSLSRQIEKEKSEYYEVLERVSRQGSDIGIWLEWYINCLKNAVEDSQNVLSRILNKSIFWREHALSQMSDRQRKVLNIYLDGKEAKLTAKNWAHLASVSDDTAVRDLQDLEQKGIISPYPGRKRKIEYAINFVKRDDFLRMFSGARVDMEKTAPYLTAIYLGNTLVSERISKLDFDLYQKGELTTDHLLHKYMAYMESDNAADIAGL